jgi:hypothetical protein
MASRGSHIRSDAMVTVKEPGSPTQLQQAVATAVPLPLPDECRPLIHGDVPQRPSTALSFNRLYSVTYLMQVALWLFYAKSK